MKDVSVCCSVTLTWVVSLYVSVISYNIVDVSSIIDVFGIMLV